ncbi:MAG: FAD-dependent monooxygenase [Novosphingopyxis baekryungensis]|jgi:2-octaprenyl-6-methoxyphenol hydroxylase|nr:FAD-dependent monooxygenase [Novosphingopyxis baekryungensis]
MAEAAIILGGGLIGLTQALALAAQGVATHVVERFDPEAMATRGFDGRTSAISSSSMAMLEAIGLGPHLTGKGCAIETIKVLDHLRPGGLDFQSERPGDALGTMYENHLLRRTLFDAAKASDRITLHLGQDVVARRFDGGTAQVELADGSVLAAPLLIAAEGRGSETREQLGITPARWQYDHSAMVSAVYHEKPHDNVAYEIFYSTGPFALLPMLDSDDGRHRSAIVWSVPRDQAPGYMKLSDRGFAAELDKASGGALGTISMAAPRSSYPLGFHHSARVTDQRIVLIGDAGHGIHPIAGQGLNLGFRDVAALTEVLVDGMRLGMDPGDAQLLARYERWRGLDTLMVAMATDGLNRLFGIPGKPASAVRRFGMGLVARAKPLQGFFMDEARGTSGAMPKLLQGIPV